MKISGYSVLLTFVILLTAACAQNNVRKGALEGMAEANVQLGIAYMSEGQFDVARKKFEKAIDQNPRLSSAHNAIAILYERLGEDELAEKHYKSALKIDPKDSMAHNNYGQFLCRKENYDAAEQHFLLAAGDPIYIAIPKALTNAGICASRMSDMAKAEGYFHQALERDPRYAQALLQMAKIRYLQNNYLGARGYLQRYEAVVRHHPESLWLAVRIEDALGDKNASSSYAVQLRNRFPDTRQAQELQEWENERRTWQ